MSVRSADGGAHDLAARLPDRLDERFEMYLRMGGRAANSVPECLTVMEHTMTARHRAGRGIASHTRRSLSERELAVLASVERYRFLTARQIEDLHSYEHASVVTGARSCRRVLERLTRHGLLWRLERRIGGINAGSASYVYTLGTLGYRVLHGQSRSGRHREPSVEFLDHTLSVAQLAGDLHRLARSAPVELIEVEPEPGCWRTFSNGLAGNQILKPDLSVVLRADEYEYGWFVEIDRATHSAAAVLRKCRLYQSYWSTGVEQDRNGLFPQVLLVAPTERRQALLARTLEQAGQLNVELFAITTTDKALATLVGEAS